MHIESGVWVVILAGGEGRRLASATADPIGRHVPKQFCRFGATKTLLGHALERASRLVEFGRIVTVVQESHRDWWEPELQDLPRGNVIAQPGNRGTGVALLRALARIVETDPEAHVLVLPSDQEVEDERAWETTLRRACQAALGAPEQVVLVGAEPQRDPDFGWIMPGEREADGSRTVLGFSEKPGAAETARLVRRGALCSTFVFAASAAALLDLFSRHPSEPLARYALALSGTLIALDVPRARPDDLPYSDFSHDLLERAPHRARVVTSEPCGWTDLGTPQRLAEWLARSRPRTPVRVAGLLPRYAGIVS